MGPTVNGLGTAGTVAAAQEDMRPRPLDSLIPTKLLVRKRPDAGQGTSEDSMAHEAGPGLPWEGFSLPSRGLCVGWGAAGLCRLWERSHKTSGILSCVENQHLKTDPYNFQLLLSAHK